MQGMVDKLCVLHCVIIVFFLVLLLFDILFSCKIKKREKKEKKGKPRYLTPNRYICAMHRWLEKKNKKTKGGIRNRELKHHSVEKKLCER